MEAWIARDKNEFVGTYLYLGGKPTRDEENGQWLPDSFDMIKLRSDLYPDIKWESEPIRVEVEISIKRNNEIKLL